jgi:hypothetical protein
VNDSGQFFLNTAEPLYYTEPNPTEAVMIDPEIELENLFDVD